MILQKVSVNGDNSWSSAVADYIRHNDKALIEACDRVLAAYQDEMLPCESFSEFCDVVGKLLEQCLIRYLQLLVLTIYR